MTNLLGLLSSLPDLMLVILGFGFIIFIHELGHFLAAKWAGIRVLAFAIGFGPPIATYRRGLGLRLGASSEAEYTQAKKANMEGISPRGVPSPTEYRLNWLPLGGYVKMLGQEDLRPGAVSVEPDSYQNTRPWKRMIVISAGVVMNMLLAGVLFIIVFMTGLKTEPAEIGGVIRGSPAAIATPINGAETGVSKPGLQAGDVVLRVNGRKPAEFTDLVLAAAMSRRNAPVNIVVRRPGIDRPLVFDIVPRQGEQKLLEMGVFPATGVLLGDATDEATPAILEGLAKLGLPGVRPGMILSAVNGKPATGAAELTLAVQESGGEPVSVEFAGSEGERVMGRLTPRPELELTLVTLPSGSDVPIEHILGLTPVMRVADGVDDVQGLKAGDIFASLGSVRFPSLAQGMAEIHANKGQRIDVSVLRRDGSGQLQLIRIEPSPMVEKKEAGQIGFLADTAKATTLTALPPRGLDASGAVPAAELVTRPGMRVVSIAGREVKTFDEIREALRAATTPALTEQGASISVPVTVEVPPAARSGGEPSVETVAWRLSLEDVKRIQSLGWESPLHPLAFAPKQYVLIAVNPFDAVRMGVAKTQRVMLMTYITFARLFEGTVKVEHLKGPVGIAQLGTKVAGRGFVWLLFFMALISVNLAVINFLPLPIVDGGQFIFLVLEQVRGKPVSVEVQNVTTMIGLLLIGTMFIIVTFQDIMNLFV
jgi:regulator of sigma E protease